MIAFSHFTAAVALAPTQWHWRGDPLQQLVTHPLVRLLNDPLVWGPVGGLIGVYLFLRGFALLKRKRLLLDTPRSTIRAAALGPVEIGGEATGPYTLVSPLSVSDCYYYRVRITHVKQRRKEYRTVEESAPLFLSDGTGELLVDARGADLQLPPSATQETPSFPDYLRHFLLQRGIELDDVSTVEEFCIRPGDQVVVFGTLQENPWAKPGMNWHESAERIGPGFLSEVAADVQRRRAFESLNAGAPSGATTATARQFDLYPPVILAKGSGPFFISTSSERQLVGSLAWQSALCIWGGPALALFCVYFFLQRLAVLH